MNTEKYLNIEEKISEKFYDKREVEIVDLKDEIEIFKEESYCGRFFKTSDGEFIYYEYQIDDFTEYELVKYIELAEAIYDKYKKKVSIYLLCPTDVEVYVKEMDIKSNADFTIKLAYCTDNPAHEILNAIKNKINKGIRLDENDFEILMSLPSMCDKQDRHYFRLESIKIINRYQY